MESADPLLAIEEAIAAVRRAAADEVVAIAEGEVAGTRELPLVWTLNEVVLHAPLPAERALALADEHQGDLPYRHLTATHPSTVLALRHACTPAGWRIETTVQLVLDPDAADAAAGASRPPREPAAAGAVTELEEREMLDLVDLWSAEDHADLEPAVAGQLRELHRREGAALPEERFGIRDEEGRPVAQTVLRRHGRTAWVENVYTRADQRGRGHARRLVLHAVARALAGRPDVCFILADDADWPKHLYAAAGFRARAWTGTFHRELPPGR